MPKHSIRCGVVVQCPDPLDENGHPRYTRCVDGQPLMAILAERLARVGNIAVTAMASDISEPATIALARKLGWSVRVRGAGFPGWRIAAAGLRGLVARYWLLVDMEWPFLDPKETGELLERMHADGNGILWIDQTNGLLPRAVVRRDVFLGALLRKLVRRRAPSPFTVARHAAWNRCQSRSGGFGFRLSSFDPKPNGLGASARALGPAGKRRLYFGSDHRNGETRVAIPTVPPVAQCLEVDALATETVQRLGGTHLSIASLTAAQQDASCVGDVLRRARRRVDARMQDSSAPHVWNRKLNRLESRNECAEVRSFPLDVALNLTTRCNARCVFCDYPRLDRRAHTLSLADIRQMTWMKYVSKLGFGGGIGDPLMHPQFLDILDHVTQTYPHLATRVITNGLGLASKVCDAVAGNLARLRISLNAASKNTWETVMRTRTQGFQRVCDSVARLARLKKQRGTDKPEIWLMLVVNALNVDDVVPLVDLASELGAQFVNYSHFSRSLMCRCDLSEGNSPYFDRERCDAVFEQAADRAKALGIGIDFPPPFHRDVPIFEAARVDRAPPDCYAPWEQCLLTGGDDARGVCLCCVGVDTALRYEKQDLTEEGFRRLWNHPILQHIRSTANAKQPNPACRFCRTVDRHDPQNKNMCRLEPIDFVLNHPGPAKSTA